MDKIFKEIEKFIEKYKGYKIRIQIGYKNKIENLIVVDAIKDNEHKYISFIIDKKQEIPDKFKYLCV